MSWIQKLLDASDKAETPRSYLYWAGISTISAIISPNVFINRGGVYKLSPNIFVLLIGESGLGKGFPINVSKKLVRLVGNTRVISGRNTIQAILKDLGTTETDEKGGVPKYKDARGYVVSGEFSTLLQEDKAALPIITELYDTHYVDEWVNTTKNSGKDKLSNPCITLFGGSTQEHFSNVVPEADIKGGFVGRILTVYEEERARVNPLSDTEAENKFPYEELADHLRFLSLLKGPFSYSVAAKKKWEEFYSMIRTKKVHDPTGAVNRLPDNVLKVAMCLSMSELDRDTFKDQLVIEASHLDEAIKKCMHLTIDSRRLTGGEGKSQLGKQTHLVVQILFRSPGHEVTKSNIMFTYYGQFDVYELDRIISTLETAGMIECLRSSDDIVIKMKEEAVKRLKDFMEKI
jgi:hypothetical protein